MRRIVTYHTICVYIKVLNYHHWESIHTYSMTRLLYVADTSSAYYILDINAPYHPQPIRTVFTPLRSKAVCLFPPCASVEDADGQRWNSKYPTSWMMSSSSGTVCKPTPPTTSTFRMLIAPIRVGRHCCRSMPVSRPHRRCAAFLLRFRGQLQRSGHSTEVVAKTHAHPFQQGITCTPNMTSPAVPSSSSNRSSFPPTRTMFAGRLSTVFSRWARGRQNS